MSRHEWHTLLTIAGAIAEAGGVLLVVFDLHGARKAARALLLIPAGRSLAMPFQVGELSPAERRRAEAQAIKNELTAQLMAPTRDQLESIEAQAADARTKMAATLTEGLGRRLLAVVLLLVGIACGMVANLI